MHQRRLRSFTSMKDNLKIIGVIPAHLDSVRFKRKILHNIYGLPMIEHVRRRVVRSKLLEKVFVASGDDEILDTVSKYGGDVIKTQKKHTNGTSRVAESIKSLNCSHILVIQGDEPVIKTDHIKNIVKAIKDNPKNDSWNSTSELYTKEDLYKVNIVKAAVNEENRILYCFRKSPSYSTTKNQLSYIRKIQGLIAFKKDVLLKLQNITASKCELFESIEQLRIISSGFCLYGVPQRNQVPSINEESDLEELYDYLNLNKKELEITNEIINS